MSGGHPIKKLPGGVKEFSTKVLGVL